MKIHQKSGAKKVIVIVAVLAVGRGIFRYAQWIFGNTLVQEYVFTNATLVSKKEPETTSRDSYWITFTQDEKPRWEYWVADPTVDDQPCPKEYTAALPKELECVFDLLEPGKSYEIHLIMQVPNTEVKNLPKRESSPEAFDYAAILADPMMYREYIRVKSISIAGS